MQKFNAPCNFNGTVSPFSFWISDEYTTGKDPLFFQNDWLQNVRGGMLGPKISEGIIQIARIAEKNKLSFEYLFGIAMNAALEKYNSNQNNIQESNNDENLENNFLNNKLDEGDNDQDILENDEEDFEYDEEDDFEDDEEDDFEDDEEEDFKDDQNIPKNNKEEDDDDIELNFK